MVKNILNCKLTSLFCLYSHNPKVHLMVGQFFLKKKRKKKSHSFHSCILILNEYKQSCTC